MDGFEYRKNENYEAGTSYPEQFLVRTLSQIYNVEHRKIEPSLGLEFDLSIKELNLKIEYSGDYWHINKEDKDQKRRKYCKDNGINYIEIIERQGKADVRIYRNNLHTKIYLYTSTEFVKKNEKLITVLKYILKQYGHQINEIDVERAVCESFLFCKQYKYVIIRKNGKIVGTQDKVFINSTNYANFVEINLDDDESEEGIVIKNANDIDSDINNEKIEKEDVTLVNTSMSDKEFRRHCKMAVQNWNNF
ncbi:MAG: hypothetical protein HDR05_12385 [Lachnospiraceae bacterium]|nr:hypothetical protein [Lachnospiraceae bacterium]